MKIKLWCCTHDMGSEVSEVVDLDYAGLTMAEVKVMNPETKKHLDTVAEQFMWEEKQPEYGFEIIED